MSKLRDELEHVKAHRERYRAQRRRSGVPVVALVGYTNAGKSTLLNYLTGAGVYVADQLFATLDPTTRRVRLPGGREALFTDTVGFIQKLPHAWLPRFAVLWRRPPRLASWSTSWIPATRTPWSRYKSLIKLSARSWR
jgi:GTP-binding protein HflX